MKSFAVFISVFIFLFRAGAQGFAAVCLNDSRPIITQEMFFNAGASLEEGVNINGPRVIRIPDRILTGEFGKGVYIARLISSRHSFACKFRYH